MRQNQRNGNGSCRSCLVAEKLGNARKSKTEKGKLISEEIDSVWMAVDSNDCTAEESLFLGTSALRLRLRLSYMEWQYSFYSFIFCFFFFLPCIDNSLFFVLFWETHFLSIFFFQRNI